MKNIESLAEQIIMAVGILGVEGRTLPLTALREAIARVTQCPEGYALAPMELDVLTTTVTAMALDTGYIGIADGCLFFKVRDTTDPDTLN